MTHEASGKLLELAVAKAICCARARCDGCLGSAEGGCFDLALWETEARAAIALVNEAAARICEEQAQVFLSPQYATGQPLSSFHERFACGRCAAEIRAHTVSGDQ